MSYPYCYNCYRHRPQERSLLIPFIGGALIGGLISPFFIKNSSQPVYYNPYPQYNYYPGYTYPYQNNYYPY